MTESESNVLTRDLMDKLILEARIHAGEAKAANATIYQIYQLLTGATGEPGNWNGAEPARSYVEMTNRYREALEAIASCQSVVDGDVVSIARKALASA